MLALGSQLSIPSVLDRCWKQLPGRVLPWPSLSPAAGSSSAGICQAPLQCIHKPLGSSCLSGSMGLFLFPCQDKKYASDKYKDIYTELSIVKAKADCDISRLKEQLKAATEAQGEKSPVNTTVSGYGQSSSSSSKCPGCPELTWESWSTNPHAVMGLSVGLGLPTQSRWALKAFFHFPDAFCIRKTCGDAQKPPLPLGQR